MGLGVINFFSNVLDTCLVFYFLIVVLNKKDINIKKTILLMLGLISFNTLVNLGLGLANFIGFLIILTISTIGYSLLLKEPFGRIIIYSISSTVLMGVIEIVSVAIISLVFNVPTSILLSAISIGFWYSAFKTNYALIN